VLRFALRFFSIVLVCSVLLRIDAVVFRYAVVNRLDRRVAQVVAWTLRLGGGNVTTFHSTITYRSSQFEISPECTGLEVFVLLVAAIVAFATRWGNRFRALGVAIPLLMVVNVIRMVTLVWVGPRWYEGLRYGHEYVWPFVVVTTTLAIWLHWAERVTREPGHPLRR